MANKLVLRIIIDAFVANADWSNAKNAGFRKNYGANLASVGTYQSILMVKKCPQNTSSIWATV